MFFEWKNGYIFEIMYMKLEVELKLFVCFVVIRVSCDLYGFVFCVLFDCLLCYIFLGCERRFGC